VLGWRDVPHHWVVSPVQVLTHLKARGAFIDLPTACHTGDIDRVRDFYVGVLGFDVVFEARDVPGWGTTGDILFVTGTPVVWAGPFANWIRACDLLLEMDLEAIVPGHGPAFQGFHLRIRPSTAPKKSGGRHGRRNVLISGSF
jgi:catechol 2,3-dioxygenase-like lactoylglutathione lyase family enzyme